MEERKAYKEELMQTLGKAKEILVYAKEDLQAHSEIIKSMKYLIGEVKSEIWSIKVKKML